MVFEEEWVECVVMQWTSKEKNKNEQGTELKHIHETESVTFWRLYEEKGVWER